MKPPTYNHTRVDGPHDPCPKCLERMPRVGLIDLIKDLRESYDDAQHRLEAARKAIEGER